VIASTAFFQKLALTGRVLVLALVLLNRAKTASAAETPRTGRNTSTNSTTSADDSEERRAPPQASEIEDDRARERAAEQASRRVFPKLLRGPYLQCGTPDSMIVRWRTDKPVPSIVRFGISETNLQFRARTRGMHTDHVVLLTNLLADTRYFYALATNTVGTTNSLTGTNNPGGGPGGGGGGRGGRGFRGGTNSNANANANTNEVSSTNSAIASANLSETNLLAGATNLVSGSSTNRLRTNDVVLTVVTNSFVTPPPFGTVKPVRVWVLGDPGTRQPTQRAVLQGFLKFTRERPIDLWLMLGDNAYTSGKDDEYQGSVFLAYPDMLRKSVLWPSLGNHDGDQTSSRAQAGEYYDIFSLPTQGQAGGLISGTEAYYSFDYANIHFVVLDSYDSDRSTNGTMARWLRNDLAANQQHWTVAYWHHPPYSKGSHDSDDDKDSEACSGEMRRVFAPILEAGGTDLVLCGHSHAYERTALIDGHYGISTNFGPAFVKNAGEGRKDVGQPYQKRTLGPGSHEGTVYVVAGSSGQASGVKGIHSAMLFALNVAGSLALDFDGPQLEVSFIDTNGVRRDYFDIVKGDSWSAGSNAFARVISSPLSSVTPRTLEALGTVASADRDGLLDLYHSTTNAVLKRALTWTLAEMADARIAAEFSRLLTNKVVDRTISKDEEDLRLTTLRSLGLMASRYEPVLDLLKKGRSADWWYFRTNYVSLRPLEQSAADLESCTIEALALSGRLEAMALLNYGRKKWGEFTFGDPLVVFRDYSSEFERATNNLAKAIKVEPVAWRRSVLAAELEKLKSE